MLLAFALVFSKLSILVLYLRVFGPDPKTRRAIWVTIAFTTCESLFILPTTCALCTPKVGQPWNLFTMPDCFRLIYVAPVQGVLNVVVDILILLLPLLMLRKLQLSRQRLYQLSAIFIIASL